MPSTSVIDIIVPCYNYAHFLGHCVGSVLEQSHRQWRMLIIDDASSDETEAAAAQFVARDPRISYRRHSKNLGNILTYNAGIAWAEGDYTLVLSADDALVPGALERAVSALDANPAVGLVWGRCHVHEGSDAPPVIPPDDGPTKYEILNSVDFVRRLAHSNCVPHPTAVSRTSVQKQLGGYSPDLPHAGDLEMWLRFALYSQVAVLHSTQAIYRRHGNNLHIRYLGYTNFEQCRAAFRVHYQRIRESLPNGAEIEQTIRNHFSLLGLRWAKAAATQGQPELSRQWIADILDDVL
jgi:glycosyltransferase involved in cell wall biosynthesis